MHLVFMLAKDPSSSLQAVMRGWKHPVTYEWIVAAHTYDLLARVNSGKKKPKPYPAPWATQEQKIKPKLKQKRSDVITKLKLMNPEENNGS